MTLLPTDLEYQPQHRQRGHQISRHSTPPSPEVNENCQHQKEAQPAKSSEDRAEDLRVCCNSRMDELQRSPIKHALKRSMSNEDNNGNISEEGAEKKRQRVENIVTNICQPRSPKSQDLITNSDLQKNKRKQFVPQQHGSTLLNGDIDVVTSDIPELKPAVTPEPSHEVRESVINQNTEERKTEKENALLKNQIKIMSEQLQKNQQMTHELTEKMKMERYELMSARLALHQPQVEMEACVRAIRAEINQAVKLAFKEALDKHSTVLHSPAAYSKDKATSTIREPIHRELTPAHVNTTHSSIHLSEQMKRSSSTLPAQVTSSPHISAPPAHHSLPNPLLPLPMYYGQAAFSQSHFAQTNSLASHLNNNMMSAQLLQAAMENELMESQLYRDRENQLNKKKRTKVTDTRLSPRAPKPNENLSPTSKQEAMDSVKMFDSYGPGSALFPAMNSLSSMHNAFLSGLCTPQQSEALRNVNGGARSPTNVSDNSDPCEPSSPETSLSLHPALPGQNITLTPLHLRKAKLMFFYVRYPSSVLLKNFFCDVHFNKNNTAQLVKWFSNFREFYYIQMEKYARQSIAEGLSPEQVEVSTESELYKILNLHYNRNNQIEVPRSFLDTIQATLREFIKAISVGKDREQSWKKPVYKVIARLDDGVPEYFKSQDWVDQLSD